MDISLPYTARDFSAELPAADYIARFRDAEPDRGLLPRLPQLRAQLGMPPFGFSVGRYLSGYATALLTVTKIVPQKQGLPSSEAGRLILPERRRLEQQLLGMERQYGGLSFAYVGTCLHCPEGTCTRPDGKPCRHPELVRPSLEACGSDHRKTTAELSAST